MRRSNGTVRAFSGPRRYVRVAHRACPLSRRHVTGGPPSSHAIRLYKKLSSGSDKSNKLHRTDQQGNTTLALKKAGAWNLKTGQ